MHFHKIMLFKIRCKNISSHGKLIQLELIQCLDISLLIKQPSSAAVSHNAAEQYIEDFRSLISGFKNRSEDLGTEVDFRSWKKYVARLQQRFVFYLPSWASDVSSSHLLVFCFTDERSRNLQIYPFSTHFHTKQTSWSPRLKQLRESLVRYSI